MLFLFRQITGDSCQNFPSMLHYNCCSMLSGEFSNFEKPIDSRALRKSFEVTKTQNGKPSQAVIRLRTAGKDFSLYSNKNFFICPALPLTQSTERVCDDVDGCVSFPAVLLMTFNNLQLHKTGFSIKKYDDNDFSYL